MTPDVEGFFDEGTNSVSYVVSDPATGKAAVIDAVLNYDAAAGRTSHEHADRIISHVRTHSLEVEWVLETHVHADHLSAAPVIREALGGKVGIGHFITEVQSVFGPIFGVERGFPTDGSQFDTLFLDGDKIPLGDIEGRVIHTPGHTPACVTYLFGDAAFVGDTIFMPDYGSARCDFPGGDAATLYRSIQKLFALPPETRLFLCHDYKAPGRDEFVWETTVGEQRQKNVHVHEGVSEDKFVAMRTARDKTLSMPGLILPAVQVNIRGGELPPPEGSVSYLKIPLNRF